jgi:hypothetical protein
LNLTAGFFIIIIKQISAQMFMKRFMVSLSLSMCCLSAFAFPSFDPFAYATSSSGGTSYAAGDPLAGQTNALGEGWVAINTTSGGQAVGLASGSLTAPTNLPSSSGNMVQLFNQLGPGARYNFPSKTSNTVYYSVLIQLQDISSLLVANTNTHGGGSFNMGLNNSTTVNQAAQPTGYAATLYYGNVTNSSGTSLGYILGIGRGTGSTNRFWETNAPHAVGDTLFVVASYEFVAGASNDIVRLWINPNPSTFGADNFPTPDVLVDNTNNISYDGDTGSGLITSFLMANRNTGSPNLMYADELRLGTTWADVTPNTNAVVIPKLSISTVDPNTVQLSWRGDATGFTLQGTGQLLSSGTPWATVPGTPTTSGTNLIQTDAISGMKFYRLKK